MKNIFFDKVDFFIKPVVIILFSCVVILAQDNKKGFQKLDTGDGSFNEIRAVIVGISNYVNIPSLEYADKDAISFYNFLRSPAGGRIDSLNIKLLTNADANATQIFEALDWITSVTEEGDLSIFYFSGHGDLETKTVKQNGFLLAHDAPVAAYMAGGTIGIKYLQDYLETIVQNDKASVILISDACKSGKLAGGMEGVTQTTAALQQDWINITKILSSQPGELSYESDRWGNGAGVFTYYLLQGLMGLADMNHDNHISLKELDMYLSTNIPRETNFEQNPIFIGNPKTRLANVDSLTLATLIDKNVHNPNSELLAMKGNVQSPTSLDTATSNLLKKFQLCLNNKELIYSSDYNENALDIYYELKDREDLKAVVNSMKYSLIAALQNNSQKLINNYLEGKVEDEEPVDVNLAYDELDNAYLMIDTTYILYDQIKAKHYFMESLFYTENEFDKRIELLKECISIQPDASYGYCELGRAYYDAKLYDDAITNYSKAIELSPRWKYPYYNTGIVYADLKENRSAIESYKKAIEIDPNYSDAYNNLGLIYYNLGDETEALEFYNKAIEIDPNYKLAYYNLGLISSDMGDQNKAIEYYSKAIEIDSKYTDAYNNLGLIYDNLGDQSTAIEYYNKAIGIDPNYKLAYYNLGIIYYNSNELDQSINNFKKAIEIDSSYTDAYNYLGVIYYYKYDYSNAINYYNKVLEIDPNYKLAYYNLGLTYTELGETEKALNNYNQTIKLDSNYTNAYDKAGSLCYQLQDYKSGINIYNKYIEFYPNDYYGYQMRGLCYFYDRNYELSLVDFNEVIELSPEYSGGYYNLACYYSITNKAEESLTNLEKAFQLGYNDFSHIEIDSDLDGIRSNPDFNKLIEKYKN